MESKSSDRQRLLKLIDGQPDPAAPPVEALPDKAASALAQLQKKAIPAGISGLKKIGLTKKDLIFLAVVGTGAAVFFSAKHLTAPKQPAAPQALETPAPAPPPPLEMTLGAEAPGSLPSRLPAEQSLGALTGFRLVGVDFGQDPVALLEDLKTGKTYFVKKNDRLLGLQVKSVEKDRVRAIYQGANVELR